MNKLKTPIEIALQIDETGMTTAKKLYEFLELAKSQYSRWTKNNIEENIYYEQWTDWVGFDSMSNGNETRDYRITTEFAKHLCMLSKSEKGKIARDYFVNTEAKLKETVIQTASLSPELQMFQSIFQAVAQQELRNKQIEQKADKALEASQVIKDTIIGVYDNWRAEMKHLVSTIQKGSDQTYPEAWNMLYAELENRAHCDLSRRIDNGRFRLQEAGATKTKVEAFGRLDVIEADPKLKEIFTTIVKEYVIKYVA